jgi:hypothetical protein
MIWYFGLKKLSPAGFSSLEFAADEIARYFQTFSSLS